MDLRGPAAPSGELRYFLSQDLHRKWSIGSLTPTGRAGKVH
jgi:hypothetical protein